MDKQANWNVVVADDHPLVRGAIVDALRSDGVQVVAEVGTGDRMLEAVLQYRPDLLIMDIRMPGLAVDLAVREAQRQFPQLKVLIVSAHDDEVFLQRFSRIPLWGYLLKDEAPEVLRQAVRVIREGGHWFSQSIAVRLRTLLVPRKDSMEPMLSERERQILELVAAGHTNHTISQRFSLTNQTVRNYLSGIYRRIGVANRSEAAVWALGQPHRAYTGSMPSGSVALSQPEQSTGQHGAQQTNRQGDQEIHTLSASAARQA